MHKPKNVASRSPVHLAVAIAAVFLLVVGAHGQAPQRLWFENPGAIENALRSIEVLCRCAIHLEKPRYTSNDMEPVPESQQRLRGARMLPREGNGLYLSMPSRFENRNSVIGVLRQAIEEYLAGGARRGLALADGDSLRLVPSEGSMLDAVRVNVADGMWTISDVLREIARQLGQAAESPFVVGNSADLSNEWPPLLAAQIRFSARSERASSALQRVLDATGRKISWVLAYSHEDSRYELMLHFTLTQACREVGERTVCGQSDETNAIFRKDGNAAPEDPYRLPILRPAQ